MMEQPDPEAAHTHPWKISDVVLFPLLGVALLLEWPWPTAVPLWRPVGIVAGLCLMVAGFALIRASKAHLDRAGQPSLPGDPTTRLVTAGPFRGSRNPNYLGALMAVSGGALLFDSLWVAAAALASGVILDIWMIRPEERYLRRRFGAEYETYCSRTRRWF